VPLEYPFETSSTCEDLLSTPLIPLENFRSAPRLPREYPHTGRGVWVRKARVPAFRLMRVVSASYARRARVVCASWAQGKRGEAGGAGDRGNRGPYATVRVPLAVPFR
jgi:hypothetical protein